ncbi:MAG: M48 family metallopeptidase [Anaerolineae bacterium]|nr:M48 family metallopeptidase [Anaerolineae bacterium]
MTETEHTLHDSQGNPIVIRVRRDRRLTRSARWVRDDAGRIVLRIPYQTPRHSLEPLLKDVARQIESQQAQRARMAARRTDAGLQARAEAINQQCFNGELAWQAIRWVGNMQARLGSCTNGGPTDGHIRISERIKDWPNWVVDYVIAHELAHRRYPDHSHDFWDYLRHAYPLTEQARGFIKGVAFEQGSLPAEDAD